MGSRRVAPPRVRLARSDIVAGSSGESSPTPAPPPPPRARQALQRRDRRGRPRRSVEAASGQRSVGRRVVSADRFSAITIPPVASIVVTTWRKRDVLIGWPANGGVNQHWAV